MKQHPLFTHPFLLVAFLLLLNACSKDKDPDNGGGTGTGVGVVRPVGTPTETAKTAVIGPNGGTLTSKDGQLEVVIPAGALTTNTTIGVAAINSTSDAAVGTAYRLTPHINFTKPVTVTMSYAQHTDSIASGKAIGIGFQDEKGVWQLKTNRSVDEASKKISVTTDHFSDWAILTPYRVTPGKVAIASGEEVMLHVVAFVKRSPDNSDPFAFMDGNGTTTIPIEQFYELPESHVEVWRSSDAGSAGAGKLTRRSRGALYKASEHPAPAANPVHISVFMSHSMIPITAMIQIKTTMGVTIKVGNTTYYYPESSAYGQPGDLGVIWEKTVGNRTYHGGMSWLETGIGERLWSDDNQFLWEVENTPNDLAYQSYWDDGKQVSTGSVKITKYGNVGEVVEGTFSVANAGIYKRDANGDIEYHGVQPITGSFKVIRK